MQLLHPTDLSPASERAFAIALRLGIALQATLRILHAEPGRLHQGWAGLPSVRKTLARWGMIPPNSEPEAVEALGIHVRKVRMGHREAAEAIQEEVEGAGIELVILATHRRGELERLVQGSVAEEVARHWPTLLLPAEARPFVDPTTGSLQLRRVLIPLDPEEDPQLSLEWVIRLLRGLGGEGELCLLSIGGALLEPMSLPVLPGWTWTHQRRQGAVVEQILEAAQDADLLVMCTRGHDSLGDRLWGSNTEQVLHGAPCALLSLPFSTARATAE
jgi:nucleotide-binding universal stress UspA family protein